MSDICEECYDCHWFVDNNDTECTCVGSDSPCEEYINVKED